MFTGKSLKYLQRWYHTVRRLKWQQVWYRLYYPLKRIWYHPQEASGEQVSRALGFPHIIFPEYTFQQGIYDPHANSFTFLNHTHVFDGPIDWDFAQNGLLWTYNLNYFDWLNDSSIPVQERLNTINSFLEQESVLKTGLQSYPSSLRILNWIRFTAAHDIKDEKIIRSLYRQAHRLRNFPEYQIMGNHLLENGISLIWVSILFDKDHALSGLNIAYGALTQQILNDGAHFERSIMYHSVLLQKIFDTIILGDHTGLSAAELPVKLLRTKAAQMFSWLQAMCFSSGHCPCFGDDTRGESYPSYAALSMLAQNLLGEVGRPVLSASGYRKLEAAGFELFFNCGQPGPAVQPGHAHADTLSFCMEYQGKVLIADRGISTYEEGKQRSEERSTAAHNTVCIADSNSSDVWKSFRMGARAAVTILAEEKKKITARHDGYLSRYGSCHERTIELTGESLRITDVLDHKGKEQVVLHLHFPPGLIPVQQEDGSIRIAGAAVVIFFEGVAVSVDEYDYCMGFNKRVKAKKIKGLFTGTKAITIFTHDTREVRRYYSRGET